MKKSAFRNGPKREGDGGSPLPPPGGSPFGAVREKRDGPSPLPDDLRCPHMGVIRVVPRSLLRP